MPMRDANHPETTQGRPSGFPWVVFRSERFWKVAAGWSAFCFAAVVSAAVIGWTYWTGSGAAGRPAVAVKVAAPEPAAVAAPAAAPTKRRVIDGVAVPEDAPDVARYFAATIDNLSVARPQAGLTKAALVYEAPVEGGITRFLAVFPDDVKADRIGPVRSARPYFLDWASEFDAVYAHVGGSPEALEKIAAYDMLDLNEFSAGKYFWRDENRDAPHNAYTSTVRLVEADQKRFSDRPAPQVAGWRFKDDAPAAERPENASLSITYGDPKADVVWTYDPATDDYGRAQGGRQQKDEDGTAVRAKNIVVQYMKVSVIDDVGRRRISTVGNGDALIAIDGLAVHGTWHKDDRTSRTRYYDASGNQIRFNAGATWIEVVPEDAKVDF